MMKFKNETTERLSLPKALINIPPQKYPIKRFAFGRAATIN